MDELCPTSKELAEQDLEIINAIRDGEESRFDELVARYYRRLFQIANGVINNPQDAEEIVQDAFVKAYRSLGSFQSQSSFYTWIRQIVMNTARDRYQYVKRRGKNITVSLSDCQHALDESEIHEDYQVPSESLSPERIYAANEAEKNIDECFNRIPEVMREVMILRHLDNLSYEEIAETLKCNLGTVKSRIARGREFLHTCMEHPAMHRGDD